jgi:hypothetical protein
MKQILIFLFAFLLTVRAEALEVTQNMQTTIGIFDACEQALTYKFDGNKYDMQTRLTTTGAFGKIYPFTGKYHAYGTYHKDKFKPEDYGYEVQSRSHHRTKRLTYKDGVPQTRIKSRDGRILEEPALVELDRLDDSIDLLSLFGVLSEQVVRNDTCDLHRYSFNGKKYSLSDMKTVGHEDIQTPYFAGNALKCEYMLEIQKGASAGFLLNQKMPIYLWILRDETTNAPFIAKVEAEKTPFGKLESYTTSVEVKK